MLRTVSSFASSCLLAAGLTAQEASGPAHKTMLLTGCLGEGLQPGSYKLTNATLSNPQPGAASAVPTEYLLTLDTGLDRSGPIDAKTMTAQFGHKVEVTARPPETAAPPPNPATQEPVAVRAVDKIERLTVTAINTAGLVLFLTIWRDSGRAVNSNAATPFSRQDAPDSLPHPPWISATHPPRVQLV